MTMSIKTGAVGNITPAATPKALTHDEVKSLSAGMAREANAFIDKYNAATTDAEKRAVFAGRTITGTIDGFVQQVNSGEIALPEGVGPINVVAAAIKPFLENGWEYSIQTEGPMGIGGTNYLFSREPLRDGHGKQDVASGIWWEESTMR